MIASAKHRTNTCRHINTHVSQPSASERLILNEKRGCHRVNSGSMKLSKCVCVCVCVYTLAHTNAGSVLDVCMKLINHMLGNCVDVPRCVLRNGLTTRRAGGIWRPAAPGPSQQNPRTAHHNRIRQSPNGLQRGLSQELTPEETMTLFKSKRQSVSLYGSEDSQL